MAESDKIKSSDLFQDDLLKPIIDDGKQLLEVLKDLEKQQKKNLATQEKLLKAQTKKVENAEDINKINKSLKDSAKERDKLTKIQKEKLKLDERLSQLRTSEFQENTKLKEVIRAVSLRKKQLIQESAKELGAYKNTSARLQRLRKEYKDLAITQGKSSKRSQELLKEITKLDKKLKDADASVGQFGRNVGNYPNALKGAVNGLKSFAGALGITAGVAGLANAIRNGVKIAKDFEQGNANLAAVLGTTSSQITDLTQDAKRLGAATSFSASQVSELQTEFAKLGFNKQQILDATQATLDLAAATGSDLGNAAAIAGATLGGFGLDASETQRVVDVMAKSFSTSALDIEKFKESMKDAAPAAKAVGVDVEETTALLGTLANAGISGSKAGNALKNTFIQLNKAGLTLEEGLDKVRNSNDKLGTATKLVGKIAATSFLTLADGVKVTSDLEKGLRNAGGAAEKMAKEQLNTLQGRLTILNSAWEGFVLGILSGDSAFSRLSKTIVEGATNMLSFLTATDKQSEALAKQQIEMGGLVKAITNANNSEETRKKLIDELNKKYPEFLENLDKEKVTNEELVLRLKDVNDELTKKIVIKKKEEELTELIDEQIDLRLEELDIIKQITKAEDELQRIEENFGKTSEAYIKAALNAGKYENQLKENRDRQKEIEQGIEDITTSYDELNPKIEDSTEKTKENTGTIADNAEARRDVERATSLQAKSIDQVINSKEKELTASEKLQKSLDNELLKRREIGLTAAESIDEEIRKRQELTDARLSTLKSFQQISETVAGDNEKVQKALLATQKAIAVSEILINSNREISSIRAEEKDEGLKRTKVIEAKAAALAGVTSVLAVGSAFDGVEDTGTGSKVDDRGGMYWVLHPHERVMSKAQNEKTGGMSNDELANVALMYNQGHLVNPFTDMAINVMANKEKKDNTSYLLMSETNKKLDALINKPVQQVNVDSFGNLVEVVYRNSVKDTITHRAKKWL